MSAFQCSPNHIAAVIGSVALYDRMHGRDLAAEAATLAAENARSVAYRYRDACEPVTVPAALIERWRAYPLSPVALLKAAQCLDYQSCECDDYERTPAAKLLRDITSLAISKLPGYEAAGWTVDDPPPVRLTAMEARA